MWMRKKKYSIGVIIIRSFDKFRQQPFVIEKKDFLCENGIQSKIRKTRKKEGIALKFSEFRYERPNIEKLKASFQLALQSFQKASNAEEQNEAMKEINRLRNDFSTMANICYIRHTFTRGRFIILITHGANLRIPVLETLA